jgi:hypothetical protein
MILPMKLGNFSRASEMSPALTHVFSSPSHAIQLTNAPPMDAFAAITNHRRKKNNASGSLLAAIRSTIQETRAHRRPILPRPNYSSIPPSVPPGPSFWASNLPISISTLPCQTPSTCVSVLTSSPTKSSTITTFATLSLLTAGSTSKFERGYMVIPKPASLQINYLKNALPSKGITNANILLVSGTTSGKTSHSAWWLMILTSRSPTCTTWTTLSMH